MTQGIEREVIRAIAQQKAIDASNVGLGSTFDELNISSLDATTIIFEIEETFGVEVPSENLDSLKTVQDIVDGIRELVASRE